jgi:transcriptional regulator PpsR
LQIAPVGTAPPETDANAEIALNPLIDRLPDGFVIIDADGVVRRANRAFLDLVQAGAEGSVIGEHLGRWLSRPGADLKVLLANVARRQVVRLFSTTIHGDLGSDTEVEISAAGNSENDPDHIAVLIRDVSRRLTNPQDGSRLRAAVASLSEQIGKTSLRELVRDTIEVVERYYIEAALDLANGNRTAASELLGLSRQSLYVKLARYGLDADQKTANDQ